MLEIPLPVSPPEAATLLGAIESALDGIFLLDTVTMRFFYVNSAGAAHIGYSQAELIGKSPLDINPELDEKALDELLRPIIDGKKETVMFETRHRHASGALIPVEVAVSKVVPAKGNPFLTGVVRDVSQRTRLEKREALQRQNYQAFFEQATAGIGVVSPTGRFLRVNPRLREMLGYSFRELSRLRIRDITVKEDFEHELNEFQRIALTAKNRLSLEKRFVRKDGSIIWVEMSATAIGNSLGRLRRFLMVVTDINVRKRAELAHHTLTEQLALKTGMVFFDELVRRLPTVLECDYAWVGRFQNEAADCQDLIAVNDGEKLLHEETCELEGSPCLAVRRGQEVRFASGAYQVFPDEPFLNRWQAEGLACVPVRGEGGGVVGTIGVASRRTCSDPDYVTRTLNLFAVRTAVELLRLEAEQELSLREAAIEQAPAGIALINYEGIRIYANRACGSMWGYAQPQDVLGRDSTIFWDSAEKTVDVFATVNAKGSWSGERMAVRRDGSRFPVRMAATRVVDADGKALCTVASFLDLSEQRQAETQLREVVSLNRRLLHKVIDLQEEERRRLATELHDELGQALTAIKMDLEYLRAHLASDDPAVDVAEGAVSLAQGTIQRLRTITRQLRPVTLDRLGLKEAIKETVDTWATRHPHIRCTSKLSGDFRPLSDPERIALYRVLQEALTNVSRHADASRVNVSLSRRSTTENNLQTMLVVEDDGRGLPERERGLGLGLIAMKERMSACGGDLGLERGPRGGLLVIARIGPEFITGDA